MPVNKQDYDNITKTCPLFTQILYNDRSAKDNNVFYSKEMFQESKAKFNLINDCINEKLIILLMIIIN